MIIAPSIDEGRNPYAIRIQTAPGQPWTLLRKSGNRPVSFKTAEERDIFMNGLRLDSSVMSA